MAKLAVRLGDGVGWALVVLGLALIVSCGGEWSDDDDDDDDDEWDDDDVPAEHAPERTPAPGVTQSRDASVDVEAEAAAEAQAPQTCAAQPHCSSGQLLYPLPPEHGCVVVWL